MADDITTAGETTPDPGCHPYEPPQIELLGAVGDLTRGPVAAGGDLNGMVISF